MNIMILVNKDFEYAGYRAGFENRIRNNVKSNLLEIARDTGTGPDKLHPSYVYKLGKHIIREYCISYLFSAGENTSNSERKYELLTNLITTAKEENGVDLIISVSTSESTPNSQEKYGKNSVNKSINGSVLIGYSFYAKDCHGFDSSTKSNLAVDEDWYVRDENTKISELCSELAIKADGLRKGMEKPLNNPRKSLAVIADKDLVSLGVINVMDYSCYIEADEATYEAYNKWKDPQKPASGLPSVLETTHAVVKMAAQPPRDSMDEIPVLFISPIVDRYKAFNDDVDGKWGNQNLTCSYNAGVVVENILENVIIDME